MTTLMRFTVQQKLYIIPALIIGVMFSAWGWYSGARQAEESENAFKGQLTLLAHTSTFMAHGSAEELATEKGWQFHRILADAEPDTTTEGKLEAMALAELRRDPSLTVLEERLATDSSDLMAVYVPARIQDACYSCHNETGIDIFSDKKQGDLVAVFGVTGSLQQVEAHKSEIFLLTVLICLLCIGVTVFVIRSTSLRVIVGPVRELVLQSQKVATGDLRSLDTPYLASKMDSADEIGMLARAYKSMLDSLRDLILRLKDSSLSVSSAASQISSTSEEIAAGTFQQTTNVNEVSSSITEISGAIHSNSGEANRTAETASSARTAAVRGEELVRRTIEGMRRIAAATQQTAETVNLLERSSEHITEIIGVIDGIADQTNLLALNAAIEAARAGEQGRGFAVVASEVQKLADRTTSATKEIGEMITRIQEDTRAAVRTMHEGSREVEGGIRLAEQAGTALSEIRSVSETMRDMVERIVISNREQSVSAEQITVNVTAITGMTEQTASGVQQIARSLEELNSLTTLLQGIVDRFRLDTSGKEGSSATAGSNQSNWMAQEADLIEDDALLEA